jgi:hypothetical protein
MSNAVMTGYEMRLLKAKTARKLNSLKTECWVVYHKGNPLDSVLQVDLFYTQGKWHAWDGCFISQARKDLANKVAETRNALA